MNPLSDLERLVAAIEHQGANIAPTYQEYMPPERLALKRLGTLFRL